jgi:SAM-dependent MidA family methyltransferase
VTGPREPHPSGGRAVGGRPDDEDADARTDADVGADADVVADADAIAGRVEVGVRRVPELAPAPLPASDPVLVERIADEIRRSGPMTFARFMHRALYDPDHGYYETAAAGPGRTGDFLTAPESHPIFGWALARQLEDVWQRLDRPERFVVREHGAGNGALAAGILDGLRRSGSELLAAIRYQAIDVARPRLEMLTSRLAEAGFEDRVEPPDERPAPGAVLANELLDALPVHLVEGATDGIRERFVVLDESAPDPAQPFTALLGPPSTPALAARLAAEDVELQPGQPAEICLELDGWVDRATAPLERGLLLLIDYGAPAAELYTKERGSTLRAYHRHRVHADPLVAVGRQDLTAHVDFTAVERAARVAGMAELGRARQQAFLAALGIGDLLVGLQSSVGATLGAYLEARSAVVRMLDPRATGAFAVLAFGRGLSAEPPLRGFGSPA